MLHVITGPDHLAAVTPFALTAKKKAWKIGLGWSLGHLFGMLIIGVLMIFFKELLPIADISNYSEQLVGLLLIGIGIGVWYKILRQKKVHKHLHVHAEKETVIHTHKHEHGTRNSHHHTHQAETRQSTFAAFGIGIVHGLAGIVHFLLFLPVLTFETWTESAYYIVGFSIGIVFAMTAYALVVGRISSLSRGGHNETFFKGVRFTAGLFAIIIGVYWFLSG
jgi:ABC-type nickel/cobalt efflux system permease component RcnA